jgi:hypothetical protein
LLKLKLKAKVMEQEQPTVAKVTKRDDPKVKDCILRYLQEKGYAPM